GPPHCPAEGTSQTRSFNRACAPARGTQTLIRFVGILRGQKCLRRGQKCLKRGFLPRSPVGEWSRGARSMPRVFSSASRRQPRALVSDRDDAALFPAIRILERYGSAKSGRPRRVRTGSLGK